MKTKHKKKPPTELVLWGKCPAHGSVWLKLTDCATKTDMRRWAKKGWAVLRLPKWESPDLVVKGSSKALSALANALRESANVGTGRGKTYPTPQDAELQRFLARRLRSRAPNPFAYMLKPETVLELTSLRIQFTSIKTSGLFPADPLAQDWPMLVLPSGRCLCIAQDNEANGPGAICEDQPL